MARASTVPFIVCFALSYATAQTELPKSNGWTQVDVGDDRVLTVPSAATLKKGTWAVGDYQIGLLTVSYGALDSLQITGAMTLPVMQIGVVATAKWRFYETSRVRLAVLGGFGLQLFYVGPDLVLTGGGGGLFADLCFSKRCKSFVSFSFRVLGGYLGGVRENADDIGSGSAIGFMPGIGTAISVHRKVKALMELQWASMKVLDPEPSKIGSLLIFNYGIRLHGNEFAADIGFTRPILAFVGTNPESVEEVMKYLPLGYPLLAFTYQW